MNVFILNTGRCGSVTFIHACKHIKNYSCGHETRTHCIAGDRLNYPDHHIEADNRLSWFLGRLEAKYGDNAVYAHLKRNDNDVANSFTKRYKSGIIKAYRDDGVLLGVSQKETPQSICLDYCNTVNSNIEMFLKNKSFKITLNLEDINTDFKKFCDLINADVDISIALSEFDNKYNATFISKNKSDLQPLKQSPVMIPFRLVGKMKRIVSKFPDFLLKA
jgi:hypothetical protein